MATPWALDVELADVFADFEVVLLVEDKILDFLVVRSLDVDISHSSVVQSRMDASVPIAIPPSADTVDSLPKAIPSSAFTLTPEPIAIPPSPSEVMAASSPKAMPLSACTETELPMAI